MVISHVIDGLFGRILVMFAWVNKNAVFFSDVGFVSPTDDVEQDCGHIYHIYILWISWCNRNHAQCLLDNMFVSQATGLSRIDQDFAESKKNRSAVQPVNSKWVWIWKVRSNTLKCDHALFIRLSGSMAFVIFFYGSAWWVRWLALAVLLFWMLLLPALRRLFRRLTWKMLGNLSGHGTHQQMRKWPMSLRMWRIWSSLWRTSTGMTSWGPWA